MKTSKMNETSLEQIIEESLHQSTGYELSFSTDYDRDLCLLKKHVFTFIKETQPDTYESIMNRGADAFLKRLSEQVKRKGVIEVLRKGIKDRDLNVKLYYKQPSSKLNVSAIKRYKANKFSVCRQLYYSLKNKNSLDMVIFLNGLPIITFELKNHYTGQNVKHAIKQYEDDRDPREKLFGFGRCIVHFAVDPDLVYMTTHLKGKNTFFLPFNKGHEDGAGNPPVDKGQRSQYLWQEILTKESLSNILENYTQIIEEEDEDTGKRKKKLFFPRYHQLRVVRKLLAHAKNNGVGKRYLIQHSAGSGKSNSITWLAHQLTELFDDRNDTIFDSVIVVTDRRVLDKQIRDNIKNYAQVSGVVEAITEGSKQLKTALEEGKRIVITTIQKFPHIVAEIGDLGSKTFAIIIDEAHSSQSGDTAAKMNITLANTTIDEDEEEISSEDIINAFMEQRKMLKNASYFAFTATPKNKTLEVFGEKQTDGKFKAFDLYSMKQAIEEEFILDVLKNYTTYQSYYKLNKKVDDNPEFDTKRAQKKLKAFVESHPFSIREKAKIMIDHFHTEVKGQIKGQAKAMVVSKSIINAVRYFYAFNEYLKEIQSPYKAIVAFSGKKTVDGQEVTEAILNNFSSADIPKRFKKSEYRFLIVANKFQTGFDQPLLHTMYVDKKLRDVQAVQTLSRLNRSHQNKDSTFVLDFFNTIDEIKEAFEPYYTTTILSEETDPNKLNDLQDELDDAQVYTDDEVRIFTDLYFKEASRDELDPIVGEAADRYKYQLSEDAQVKFLQQAKTFTRTYAFLSKILTFTNEYWERLHWFLKFLIPKIKPETSEDLAKGILEAIELDSYKTSKVTTSNIALEGGGEVDPASTAIGGGKEEPELDTLEAIINSFNSRFGNIEWMKDDKVRKVWFQEIPEQLANDLETMTKIKNSDRQNAKITSDDKVSEIVQDFIFTSTDAYKMFSDNKDFKRMYLEFIFEKIWENTQGKRAIG